MSTLKESRVAELLQISFARESVPVPSVELREILAYAIGCRKAQAERDFAMAGLRRVNERLDELLKEKMSDDDDFRSSDPGSPTEATDLQRGSEA